jgi:putative toxin-antitoxin system antitoxin component (TIGR02293 family)
VRKRAINLPTTSGDATAAKRFKYFSNFKNPHSKSSFFISMFRASPMQRIYVIKAGVPAKDAKLFVADFGLDQRVMFNALSLKAATVNRKANANQSLSTEDGERVIGLAKLLGQAAAMLEESGDRDMPGFEDFDTKAWLSHWLSEPSPALGGVPPLDLLDTMEGQSLVSQSLAQMQSGAYA